MAKENKPSNEVMADMDNAAALAVQELKNCKTAEDVAKWMKKHYAKAGYKRLSKGLMQYFKQ